MPQGEPTDAADPKGLLREAYRIEGITPGECRSIFLDWALSLPETPDLPALLALLIERHARAAPDHPMSRVLHEGQAAAGKASRKGGRAARLGYVRGEG